MLNVGKLENGFVIDHIKAGRSMDIYKYLGLEKLDCCVAIIKNARSNKMGKKDIIKIDGGLDLVDLDILGFVDDNITINVIKDGVIAEKKSLSLPKTVTNVIKCKNPRCISQVEQELDNVFILTDENTVKRKPESQNRRHTSMCRRFNYYPIEPGILFFVISEVI